MIEADHILLTETSSRLNLSGFQSGLGWVLDANFGRLISSEVIEVNVIEMILDM